MTETAPHHVAAATYIRALLDGGPPNGIPPDAFHGYCDVIGILQLAHAHGGTPRVRESWRDLLRRHPELAELVSGDHRSSERKVRWTANELLTADFPPIRWVVPGVFPEGLTVLAGRPKIGKSLLALQLAHAVSSGGKIFNQQLTKAPVLYIALEDSARRLQQRMRAQTWPADTAAMFYTEWEPLDGDGLMALQVAMEAEDYRLITIDTLSRALSGEPDQNKVGDMTMVLSMLQRLALDHRAMIAVIDHHSKPRGTNPDPVDDVLGSTGKGAVADCVAGLYRERGKLGAVLHIVGRDLDRDKRLALEWDAQLSCWKFLGDADEVAKDSLQVAILAAVRQIGGETTTTELGEYLGKHKGTISREITELVQKQQLIPLKKRGREQPYGLPGQEERPDQREVK